MARQQTEMACLVCICYGRQILQFFILSLVSGPHCYVQQHYERISLLFLDVKNSLSNNNTKAKQSHFAKTPDFIYYGLQEQAPFKLEVITPSLV